MKPCLWFFVRGRSVPHLSFSSDGQGIAWEFMEINGFLRVFAQDVVSQTASGQDLVQLEGHELQQIVELNTQIARYCVAVKLQRFPLISHMNPDSDAIRSENGPRTPAGTRKAGRIRAKTRR